MRALGRPLGRFIHPVFAIGPQIRRPPRPRPNTDDSPTFNAASTWAGCVLSGNQWQSVYARWTVPTVLIPTNPITDRVFLFDLDRHRQWINFWPRE